jgi:hypothetical protein
VLLSRLSAFWKLEDVGKHTLSAGFPHVRLCFSAMVQPKPCVDVSLEDENAHGGSGAFSWREKFGATGSGERLRCPQVKEPRDIKQEFLKPYRSVNEI